MMNRRLQAANTGDIGAFGYALGGESVDLGLKVNATIPGVGIGGRIAASFSRIFGRFTRGFGAAKSIINPRNIHFMQSSIKNTTGNYTVLGNSKALANGSLNPNVLRMNV